MVPTPWAYSCQNHLESIWWFSTSTYKQEHCRWKCWDHEKRAEHDNSPFLYQTQITNDNKNWRCGYTEYEQTQYRSLGECQHFHFDSALFIIVLVWGGGERKTDFFITSFMPSFYYFWPKYTSNVTYKSIARQDIKKLHI